MPRLERFSPLFERERGRRFVRVCLPAGAPVGLFFAVEIVGDALTGAQIEHGDWLIFRQSQEANNGQLCAVQTPDGLTVRRIYFEPEAVRLAPINNDYAERCYDYSAVEILGVMVSSQRLSSGLTRDEN